MKDKEEMGAGLELSCCANAEKMVVSKSEYIFHSVPHIAQMIDLHEVVIQFWPGPSKIVTRIGRSSSRRCHHSSRPDDSWQLQKRYDE